MLLWVSDSHVSALIQVRKRCNKVHRENIHSETYSRLLSSFMRDATQQKLLFEAVEKIPSIMRKAQWCMRWISDSAQSFASRVVAFGVVEGIFFASSFTSIFWLKQKSVMPGLCYSNELISRDEAIHTEFACLIYSHLMNRPSHAEIVRMVTEAVDLEKEFVTGMWNTVLTPSDDDI